VTAGASGRFDFAGSLTIFHPLSRECGREPRPERGYWRKRPYRDNNKLKRIRPG
jgi:hypothetical protein